MGSRKDIPLAISKNSRLIVDYEQLPEISEAMIYTAMIRLMLKRLHLVQNPS